MATARTPDLFFQRGRTSLSDQSIAAASTFLWQIPLNRSDYEVGTGILGLPVSIANTTNRRNTASLFFTTVASQTVAQSSARTSHSISTYPSGAIVVVTTWPFRFYAADLDSLLSAAEFAAGVTDTLVQIKSARINGTNLEIEIQNTHGTLARTFSGELEWRVWKT